MEPDRMISPSLPIDVWAVLHMMLQGQRPAFHVERQVMQAFEAAMQAAQAPPAPPIPDVPDA